MDSIIELIFELEGPGKDDIPLRSATDVSRPRDDDCFHGSGQDQLREMLIEGMRKKASPVEREERTFNVFLDEETENGVNALAQASPGTMLQRCSSCGLEWESAHDGEACPLRELEMAFSPANSFLGYSDATG